MENSQPEDINYIKKNIQKVFLNLFKREGKAPSDFFDTDIWFLRNDPKAKKKPKYFEEIISETPKEDYDIIKFVLVRAFMKNDYPYFRIKVDDFVTELTEILVNLHLDNKRVDSLIKKYEAHQTKNLIEQSLLQYDKQVGSSDETVSKMKMSLISIEGIDRGDFKFSLGVSFLKENEKMREKDNEVVFEYKLNNIVKSRKDDTDLKFNEFDYFFPEIEFYSFETTSESAKLTGTNINYFFVKCENLNNNYEDVNLSDKKHFLDLFLTNISSLINNFKPNKEFEIEVPICNDSHNFLMKIRISVRFDPLSIISIFNKIIVLLQDLISMKVVTEHKWNTIMNYFPDMKDVVRDIIVDSAKSRDCSIF